MIGFRNIFHVFYMGERLNYLGPHISRDVPEYKLEPSLKLRNSDAVMSTDGVIDPVHTQGFTFNHEI